MNKLKDPAYVVADKDTGKWADWSQIVGSEQNAKTRYSYNRAKDKSFKSQSQEIVIQMINPIKLHRMLDDLVGTCNTPEDLIKIIKQQIDAE